MDELAAAAAVGAMAMDVDSEKEVFGSDKMAMDGVDVVSELSSTGTLANPAGESVYCQSHGRGAGTFTCIPTAYMSRASHAWNL